MKLSEKIKNEPYLKAKNLIDSSDVECAISILIALDNEYGKENKTLLAIWAKILEKKKKLQ